MTLFCHTLYAMQFTILMQSAKGYCQNMTFVPKYFFIFLH